MSESMARRLAAMGSMDSSVFSVPSTESNANSNANSSSNSSRSSISTSNQSILDSNSNPMVRGTTRNSNSSNIGNSNNNNNNNSISTSGFRRIGSQQHSNPRMSLLSLLHGHSEQRRGSSGRDNRFEEDINSTSSNHNSSGGGLGGNISAQGLSTSSPSPVSMENPLITARSSMMAMCDGNSGGFTSLAPSSVRNADSNSNATSAFKQKTASVSAWSPSTFQNGVEDENHDEVTDTGVHLDVEVDEEVDVKPFPVPGWHTVESLGCDSNSSDHDDDDDDDDNSNDFNAFMEGYRQRCAHSSSSSFTSTSSHSRSQKQTANCGPFAGRTAVVDGDGAVHVQSNRRKAPIVTVAPYRSGQCGHGASPPNDVKSSPDSFVCKHGGHGQEQGQEWMSVATPQRISDLNSSHLSSAISPNATSSSSLASSGPSLLSLPSPLSASLARASKGPQDRQGNHGLRLVSSDNNNNNNNINNSSSSRRSNNIHSNNVNSSNNVNNFSDGSGSSGSNGNDSNSNSRTRSPSSILHRLRQGLFR